MRKMVQLGAVAAVAGALILGGTVPALADTNNFGQMVYNCANVMLPYDLASDGSILMTMPNGTTMYFRNFGSMTTYMQQQMCS